jgi:abortive infection bacteriophage resistance protein
MANYIDRPLNFNEQIALLKSKGLAFANEDKALHILQNVSYFRMKSYLMPLMEDKINHTFKEGATFEQAFELYKFDDCLRKLVMAELEKIEISVRTQMAYKLADEIGIYWFSDNNNFIDQSKHAIVMTNLKSEFARSDDEQILRFKEMYSDPFPPAWITLEISSFGTLSMLYKLLKPSNVKRSVANFYGISDKVFESWLHSIVYVRNICAHHSRLWNKSLRIKPLYPRKTEYAFLSPSVRHDRAYYVLSIIQYLLKIVNPKTTFPVKLKNLLNDFPSVDIAAMGFSNDWFKEELWR